jgi:hypothetical protein
MEYNRKEYIFLQPFLHDYAFNEFLLSVTSLVHWRQYKENEEPQFSL